MIETILISVLLSAVVAFFVSRQSSKHTPESNVQKVITTENLIITDGDARPRMVFSSGPDGPKVSLSDKNGKVRLGFGVYETTGPGIALYDTETIPQVSLQVAKDGGGVALADKNGKSRMVFLVTDNAGPTILIFDAKGTVQAQMSQQETGYKFVLHDAEGNPRGVFGSNEEGASLQFAGPDGKLRTVIGVDQGTSGLKVFNEKGDLRAELGYDAKVGDLSGAFLSMFDVDRKLRLLANVGGTGPTVKLYDEDSKIAVALELVKTVPVFALFDSEDRPDPAVGALAFEAVIKAVREGRDQSEVNTIFQQTVKEDHKEHKLGKSVFIIPGAVLVGTERINLEAKD